MTDTVRRARDMFPRRNLTLARRWLFCGATLLLVLVVMEVVSATIWKLHRPWALSGFQTDLENVAVVGTDRKNLEVLHPYLGWVFNPEAAAPPVYVHELLTVNSLGFVDDAPSVQRRHPESFLVGILGGSVAQQMGTIGEKAFRDRLSECPALRGREIHLVRLAMPGYKQPQQVMALNYILSLGGEFDIVVNIDGYNEMGLAIGENDTAHVFSAYPRSWDARLIDVLDPRNTSLSYRLLSIRATRQLRARWVFDSMLYRSWTLSLVWSLQDAMLKNCEVALAEELRGISRDRGLGFARQGPKQMYLNEEQMYEHATEIWKNSSLQLHHVCSSMGVKYFHFLQPNQYHIDSKPLSQLERDLFYRPTANASRAIEKGYPLLIAAGTKLQERGVAFRDLTQLFSHEYETLYNDYCCHYNSNGNNILAKAVASTIAESLTRYPNRDAPTLGEN